MPGLRIKIDVNEAAKATADLRKDLKALGGEAVLTERNVKALEARLLKRMGADEAEKAVKRLSDSLGLSKKEVDGLKQKLGEHLTPLEKANVAYNKLKASWMGLTAAAVGVWMAFAKVREYLDLGASALKAEAAYAAMTESVGANSEKIIRDSQRATRGLIDDSDMMQRAVFAMTQDIDPEQIPQLFAAAAVAAKKTGKDIGEVSETIIDAVGTDMPRGLKRLGMITKDQMAILNKAFALGITDIKLLDMLIANTAVDAARLSGSAADAADNLKRFDVEVKQLKETIGKEALLTFQKFFGLMQGGAGTFLLLAGAATRANLELLKYRANSEKDPTLKRELQKEVTALEARTDWMATTAGELLTRGEENITGEKRKTLAGRKTQPATGFGGSDSYFGKFSKETLIKRAEALQDAETEKALRELQKKEEVKLAAERIKLQQDANQAIAEGRLKTSVDMMQKDGAIDSEMLAAEIAGKRRNNELYKKDALATIAAEAEARASADKYFPKDYFIESKQQELAITLSIKRSEVENLEILQRKIAILERANFEQAQMDMAVETENKMRKDTITGLNRIFGLERQRRDAEIDHQRRMVDYRARYGDAGPRDVVMADFKSQIDRLESEKRQIEDEIRETDKRMKPGTEGYEEWVSEKLGKRGQINNINAEIQAMLEERAQALREFDGSMFEGMVSGFKNYRAQIGSEFQIWEQFAIQSAQNMERAVSDYFFDAITGKFESFGDFMTKLGQAWGRSLSDAMAKEVTAGSMKMVKSLASWGLSMLGLLGGGGMDSTWGAGGDWTFAKGAAFQRGNVIPFAAGTTVDRPTYFPMANGNTGLMAEKGIEAIMPLARTKTGELGVKATSQGATIHMPMTIIGGTKKMAAELRSVAEEAVIRKMREYM